MLGVTYRGYVAGATIRSTMLMVPRGGGGLKSLGFWGKRPAGYNNVKKTPNVRNLLCQRENHLF